MTKLREWLPKHGAGVLWLVALTTLAATFKILPHTPNFSPELTFVFYLGAVLTNKYRTTAVFFMIVIVDAIYALIAPYPAFGWWTFFTYTGFWLTCFWGSHFHDILDKPIFLLGAPSMSIAFWVWTNFGVWVTSGMYPLSVSGLFDCFFLALPFLGYSFIASCLWSLILFAMHRTHWTREVFSHELKQMQ